MTTFTVETLPAISHNSIPVITTELLANLYGATAHSITKNHRNNIDRFVPGKHFYKIIGQELNTLRVTFGDLQIHPKTRALILWTERGAARHAKMLETDQAWEVFEKLEDCYFNQREGRPEKTTTLERTPLRDAVNLLVGKTGMIYSDAYSLIHQRFDVERIEDLTQTQMVQAIEYIHCLIIDNRPATSPLFSGRVLLTFKEGRMELAEVARDDERLISATTMVELLQKRGFVIMTKDELTTRIAGALG
ncbi:ORF6N domain-containing protein [Dickeya dadantii]|uniref:ORF6N domain-containing protein n=1 Tax=Dickeya dadantii TaxID=204038 RepID=UPI001495AB20|nr:ORF6N domain-containing protein [Dickeya dadantii]NPE57738.1 ORF6N domain-containing protein [Dickeya dadantii]NPE69788.1 ORF6N domain-containing protein [Dickeya dadantii]